MAKKIMRAATTIFDRFEAGFGRFEASLERLADKIL